MIRISNFACEEHVVGGQCIYLFIYFCIFQKYAKFIFVWTRILIRCQLTTRWLYWVPQWRCLFIGWLRINCTGLNIYVGLLPKFNKDANTFVTFVVQGNGVVHWRIQDSPAPWFSSRLWRYINYLLILTFVWRGGQVECRRREYRGASDAKGWGLGRGCPLPNGGGVCGGDCASSPTFWFFFASEWCILRAFWHMIRQFTTPILIRWKSLQKAHMSSPNHAKSSSGYVLVAFVCVFVSRIRLTRKVMNGFWWNFLERWGVPQEEVIRFWDQLPQLSPGESTM